MTGYIENVLLKYFRHRTITLTQTQYKVYLPKYTKEPKYVYQSDITDSLDKKGITRLQAVFGSILHYAQAIDHPIIPALNEILRKQAIPTSKTYIKMKNLLHYVVTFLNIVI